MVNTTLCHISPDQNTLRLLHTTHGRLKPIHPSYSSLEGYPGGADGDVGMNREKRTCFLALTAVTVPVPNFKLGMR